MFQSTYLYKVRHIGRTNTTTSISFNPRTYIRYDIQGSFTSLGINKFQSTYLYKVRPSKSPAILPVKGFQSTYLYKVRPAVLLDMPRVILFQSTYLYKVRRGRRRGFLGRSSFNPRTYIRYDLFWRQFTHQPQGFNPRTYIRYDSVMCLHNITSRVSIHVPI